MSFECISKNTNKFWHDIGYKSPFFLKYKPTFNTGSIELAVPLTATDMRMRENDVTLGIPKTSYTVIIHMHIWFQKIKKCITHLKACIHPNPKFMVMTETSTFGIFYGRNVCGRNVWAETSGPKRPWPKCPWQKCPSTPGPDPLLWVTCLFLMSRHFRRPDVFKFVKPDQHLGPKYEESVFI